MKINKKSMLYGTLILTIANICVRLLGFLYRIFLSRTIGAEGMGVFQLTFPVYIIAITLTSSGVPIAVSRLVAQKKAVNDKRGILQIVHMSVFFVVTLSILLCLFIITNSNSIAVNILNDSRTKSALLALSPCILVTALSSVYKGYFYGIKNIQPPALTEIIEQILRISLVISILLNSPYMDEETTAAIAAFGITMGELCGLLFINFRYKKSVKNYKAYRKKASTLSIFNNICSISAPITFTRLVSSGIISINSILIPQRLMVAGMTRENAVSVFGIISGMVMPLIFLPFTLISALSVVIIPNLSENLMTKNWRSIREKIAKSLKLTCLTAFASMAILIPLAHPIGIIIFDQPAVGTYLKAMGMFIIFACLRQNLSSILNGLGKQNRAALHFIIGGAVQLFCTYTLVANPNIKIYGLLIGFALNNIIVALLNLAVVIKVSGLKFRFGEWIIKPAFIALVTGSIIQLQFVHLLDRNVSDLLSLLIATIVGVIIMLLQLIALNCIPHSFLKRILKSFSN